MVSPDVGADALGERVVAWMVAERPALDRLMAEEGSRALHEEFLLAEGGALPDARERLARARAASARAWLRHLARALEACWPDAPAGMGERVGAWLSSHGERLEALLIDEQAQLERRGRSGDAFADQRAVELGAQTRLFAEAVGAVVRPGGEDGPAFSRRVAAWQREHAARGRAVVDEAVGAGAEGLSGADEARPLWERAPEEARRREAALLWARVRFLAEGTAAGLVTAGPPVSAEPGG